MEKFTDAQNEQFGKIFGAIKKSNPSFETDAMTMLGFDEDNFINLYNDPNNTITGTAEDLEKVKQRANYLNL